MNYKMIRYILGWVMIFEGSFFLLPCLVAGLYRESEVWIFLGCAIGCAAAGKLLSWKKPEDGLFYAREGFVVVAASWIILSAVGALPFWISREIPSYVDALFETVSGFTTTGASILSDVEALSHGMLFWRSFTHWIGGMGVLVFILAILPMAGGQTMHLMRAESPGPSVGKLVPRLQKTAFILYAIYFAMTLLELIILIIAKMPLFDALCLTVGTAGTGGFAIKGDSVAGYTAIQQTIITIFMFLFGVNFNAYYLILMKRWRDCFKIEEVRWYFLLFVGSVFLITLNLTDSLEQLWYNVHHAAFTVSSVMTTTGYGTVDFDKWPEFSRALIVILMFVGACAGSTGGGIKVSRFVIYFKSVGKELYHLIHPRSVKVLKMDGKVIEHDTIRSVNIFMIVYILIFALSTLLVSLDNEDLVTCFTSVAATFNNIGPGLGKAGPTGNFGFFSDRSKFVLMFDMLAGRLEIFPMLVLFFPSTWKKY